MDQRVPDIYYARDFPVLLAIGKWEVAGLQDQVLRPEQIAEQLGKAVSEVIQSVGRLWHSGLVEATDATTFGGEYYLVNRLTGAGLREVGAWPKATDLTSGLVNALEREAAAYEGSEPTKAHKIRSILTAISDVGTDFSAKLAAELLKSMSH